MKKPALTAGFFIVSEPDWIRTNDLPDLAVGMLYQLSYLKNKKASPFSEAFCEPDWNYFKPTEERFNQPIRAKDNYSLINRSTVPSANCNK